MALILLLKLLMIMALVAKQIVRVSQFKGDKGDGKLPIHFIKESISITRQGRVIQFIIMMSGREHKNGLKRRMAQKVHY